MLDPARLRNAYQKARRDLLAERDASGHWVGELSDSALSTATATSALSLVAQHSTGGEDRSKRLRNLIAGGVEHLVRSQNSDGGWGDTDKSLSNIATTMLASAALHLAGVAERCEGILEKAGRYVEAQGGLAGLRRRYGRDKTFAVPILTNCALAGMVPWREVAPLPFELACLPQATFRFLRLPVVSYAIPALVAIGQARYFHGKPLNPIARCLRAMAVPGSLRVLHHMQPQSGGFLEAAPLTSFVVMSLAAMGRSEHPVVERGVDFLVRSVRPNGSWPIDTNLATWVTTLAVNALVSAGEDAGGLVSLPWLLGCQHREVHPFTNAQPGGWGWTDLSGAVPDADDTAGALLALAVLRKSADEGQRRLIDESAAAGIGWLLDLQNRDGGWPTFCRGWGTMPFDRSGVDLTAHVLRALTAWKGVAAVWSGGAAARRERVVRRGLDYIGRQQRADGSWTPLWFGNQSHPEEENPVYGTGRVLLAYRDLGLAGSEPFRRGIAWLASHQGPDGGWGHHPIPSGGMAEGMSSVEETAVAVEALLAGGSLPSLQRMIDTGLGWLVEAAQSNRYRQPWPIGFYFARLWYYERLYPLVFTVGALGQAVRRLPPHAPP